MKLIALLIGLLIERLATHLFHLRELRWLDRLIDAGFRVASRFIVIPGVAFGPCSGDACWCFLSFSVIFLAGDSLHGYPYMVLAILVLFFSLGPKDVGEDIDEYCKALQSGDGEEIRKSTKALTEKDLPTDNQARIQLVEEAAFVQGNNRLFAVIFWFVLLGPFGAWSYRVTDLIRRTGRIQRGSPGRSGQAPPDAGRGTHVTRLVGVVAGEADRNRIRAGRQFRRRSRCLAQPVRSRSR